MKTVVVAGDVMVDWVMSVDPSKPVMTRSWKETDQMHRYRHDGGAWMLADLVERFAAEVDSPWEVRKTESVAYPDGVNQSYTVVGPAKDGVWRVKEFLGVEHKAHSPLQVKHDHSNADIVVLLDSDLGFDKNRNAWPAALDTPGHKPWVILKTSVPAFGDPLWRRLISKHKQRLIVVTTVDDLRRKEIQLIRRLSWERTAQDLVREMKESPALRAFQRCQHLIVSFGAAGAILFNRKENPRLIFDPSVMEGEWEAAGQGMMIGNTSVLTAAIAHEVMIHSEWPQLADAVPRGIVGMRALFEKGYTDQGKKRPTKEIVKAALTPSNVFSAAPVAAATDDARTWTVLEDRLRRATEISPDKDAAKVRYELAARVATFGADEALRVMPQLRIGNLFTADRDEIESLRSIKNLLAEYVKRKPSKPFSIAVFGTPGSGKSFGVEEVAKSIAGEDAVKVLTFNLTQFARPDDLHGAFHQVRDVSLTGKIPVVFWDEFDTTQNDKPLGWLRYFIGPMQDGLFQVDQLTHPIGTSIFVFAGGTATTKEEFVHPVYKRDERVVAEAERKKLKVPDFISRLKGFLNVTGPNPRDRHDQQYLIRRAILLRAMLQRHCPDLFREEGKKKILKIEAGVLYAFLNTKKYIHGARSMESVIAMSTLAKRKFFDSSSLPPEPQLALHVSLPFESLTYELEFTHDVVRLERLAVEAQEVFRETKRAQHWHYGPIRDDKKKIHDLLVAYDKLPERAKEASRDTVRWIPRKLARVHYVIVPEGSGPYAELSKKEVEELARMEHLIWMDRKKADGYALADVATESPKQSPYLVPWEKLDKEFKDVDREFIRAIPKILKKAGYVIIKDTSATK